MRNISLKSAISATLSYHYKATWISRSVRTGSILLTDPIFKAPNNVLETRILVKSSWIKFLNETYKGIEVL